MDALWRLLVNNLKRFFAGRQKKNSSQTAPEEPPVSLSLIQEQLPASMVVTRNERESNIPKVLAVEQNAPQPTRRIPDNQNDKRANYRLPYDILTQVFDNLAQIEDPKSPLERILAVCHFWRDTALDHHALWTTFRVHIIFGRDVRLWRTRLQERLKRVSPAALLDITITLVNRNNTLKMLPGGTFDDSIPPHGEALPHESLGILKVFAGKHGGKATRWRTLTLDLLHLRRGTLIEEEAIDYFLQHRTPNLEALELRGVVTRFRYHKTIFPYSPKLRKATFHSCQVSNYPSAGCLASLELYSAQTHDLTRDSRAIHLLSAAPKLTHLEIGLDWTEWETPIIFPRVRTLMMPANVNLSFIIMIQVPSLRHLGLGLDIRGHFATIQDCKGIPCWQIEALDMFDMIPNTKFDEGDNILSYTELLQRFGALLKQMRSLRTTSWFDFNSRQRLLGSPLEMHAGIKVPDELFRQSSRQPLDTA